MKLQGLPEETLTDSNRQPVFCQIMQWRPEYEKNFPEEACC